MKVSELIKDLEESMAVYGDVGVDIVHVEDVGKKFTFDDVIVTNIDSRIRIQNLP